MSDYERIASVIEYLNAHIREQPSLQELADQVHLSPFHFQRLFSRWAGTSPKRFLQVLTLELGKQLLQETGSLLELSDELGLSSSSRLHDHFVQLEAVTPGEYRSRGHGLSLRWGVHATGFGHLFVAVSPKGICRAAFMEQPEDVNAQLAVVQEQWPLATLTEAPATTQPVADVINACGANNTPLSLHVQGTNFQISVWRALLRIPPASAVSYTQIAQAVGSPRASRATGSAIGANPVAFLIPCHRVIQQSGALGGYRWGTVRKQAMQCREKLLSDRRETAGIDQVRMN